jgi:hypothetical protein
MRSKVYCFLLLLGLLFSFSTLAVGASIDEALPISEGTYRGEVWTGTGPNGSQVDVFRITLQSDEKLTIRATKLGGEGTIEVQSFDSTPYPIIPGIYIRLRHTGDTVSRSYINTNINEMVIYLEVWGDGNYEIDVDKQDLSFMEPVWLIIVILILIVVITIISMVMPLGMMFIAVLLIIFLIRRSDKNKRRRRKARRRPIKGKIKHREGRPR